MASFMSKIISSSQSIVTKRHTVKRILAVPPRHLYNIIIDVNSYSEFLPFCKSSHILRSSDCGTMFDASLQIGFGGGSSINSRGGNIFEEEYVSRVTKKIRKIEGINSLEWIVTAKSIRSNLFNGLSSSWRLTESEINNGGQIPELVDDNNKRSTTTRSGGNNLFHTNVEFEVEISVSNHLIAAALDGSLESVAKQQVAAFEKRCFDIPFSNK